MKSNKKLLVSALGFACLLSLIGGFSAIGADRAASADSKLVSELFESTTMQFNPARVDANNTYTKFGLEIVGEEGSSTTVDNTFAGEFSFEYLPIQENGEYTFQTLKTTFNDAVSGDEFAIVVEQAYEQYEISVEFNGVRAGIFYMTYQRVNGQTRLCNTTGTYTQLDQVGSLTVTFDPETMSVYASNGVNEVLIWNMSVSENDAYDVGQTLDNFTFYTVAFSMHDMGVNGTGTFMLYGINDVLFDGYLLETGGTPVMACNVKEYGLVDSAYDLPAVGASNLFDGEMEIEKELYDPSGKRIRIYNDTFIPQTAGVYTLHCETETSYGEKLENDYAITVYAQTPAYTYELDYALQTECEVGETVYIPKLFLSGGLNVGQRQTETTVTIYRNGIRMKDYTDVYGGFYYNLRGEGTYTLEYKAFDQTLELEIYSSESPLKFDLSDAPVYLGETVDVSQTPFYVDGAAVDYDVEVVYPSGAVYANKRFEITETGLYLLKLSAKVGGVTHTLEKELQAYEKIADMFSHDDASSVDYAANTISEENGIRVRVNRANATVTYEKEIDISKYVDQTEQTSGGVTVLSDNATPFIDMAMDAIGYMVNTTSEIKITLTDASDASNKIEVLIRSDGNQYISYVRARAGDTGWAGFNNRGTGMTINNAQGYLYTDGYGSEIVHTFYGAARSSAMLTDSRITLYYDNETKQILTHPANGISCIVTDFDDKAYVTNGMLWGGFKSDKVVLSITGGRPVNTTYDYFIFSIDGQTFDNGNAEYVTAPEIRVEKETVGAVKGYYIDVPVAKATDHYGITAKTLVTKVYYEKDGARYDVNVENGRFYAKYAGDYAIEYIAEDVFGNRSTKTIRLTALNSIADMSLGYSIACDATYTSAQTGISVGLYAVDDLVVTDHVGAYEIERVVFEKATQTPIATANDTALFEASGVYTVQYVATDELGRTATLSYDITVEKSNAVVVSGSVPHYVGFVYGNSYELADIYVKDYSEDSPAAQKTEIYLNGEKLTSNTLDLAYKAQNATEEEIIETVTLEYTYDGEVIRSYELPLRKAYTESVRIVGKNEIVTKEIKMERYFDLDEGMTASALVDAVKITTTDDEAKAQFANALSSRDFSVAFDIADARTTTLAPVDTNIQAVTIWLIDANDESKTLKFRYEEQGSGAVRVLVNDSAWSPDTEGNFQGTVLETFTMSYKNAALSLYDASGQLQKIASYLDGRPFEGFSDHVYMAVAIERIDKERPASIKLMSVCGQGISDVTTDAVAPVLSLNGECVGTYNVGDKVTLPSAVANDVLSDVSAFHLTVTATDVNGITEIVSSVDGTKLSEIAPTQAYVIEMSKIATYKAVYTAIDECGNESTKICVLNAIDLVDPVVKINGDMAETWTVDEKVTLPSYVVEYVLDSEDNLSYIVCITPSDRHEYIADGAYTPKEKGLYIVRYVAMDVYGNSTIVEFKVICK